jgi:glycosyltransferase involved in cell wall biosynthesis
MVEAPPRYRRGAAVRADGRPLVSIGVPVYNAERHLAEALDSLLAQDYEPLEIVISDNASTDGTEAICRDYAGRDRRVAYHRAPENQGAVWNFNQVFALSHGHYFMWAAHDDCRAPRYVGSCVTALEQRPDAVMCCTEVAFIDDQGRPVLPWTTMVRPVGASTRARVSAIGRSRFWLDVYGLIRADALRRSTLARPVWGFDVSIQLQLCLAGPVLFVPEPLFLYRVDERKTAQRMAATLGSEDPRGAIAVNWSAMALALLGDTWRARLSLPARVGLVLQLWVQLCALNGLVGSGIVRDVGSNLRRALAARRLGRVAGLCLIALAALPVQNSFVRSVFRRGRPAAMARA